MRNKVTEIRLAVDKLLQNRGRPVLEEVRKQDPELAYQVGMLLGDISRILDINDISYDFAVPIIQQDKK